MLVILILFVIVVVLILVLFGTKFRWIIPWPLGGIYLYVWEKLLCAWLGMHANFQHHCLSVENLAKFGKCLRFKILHNKVKQIRTPPSGHQVQCLEMFMFNSVVRGSFSTRVSFRGPFFLHFSRISTVIRSVDAIWQHAHLNCPRHLIWRVNKRIMGKDELSSEDNHISLGEFKKEKNSKKEFPGPISSQNFA